MNANNVLRSACLGLSTAFLLSACSTPAPPKESGFLSNYKNLHEEPAPGGGTRLVYVNPDFTPARYTAVWLDPIIYFPDPKPGDSVSVETLTEIRMAADRMLREKIGRDIRLVDQPGPGVARVSIAITAVGSEQQALAPYQYIPIALVLTGAKAVIEGGMPRDATIAIESKVTDSQSRALLYASVRGGTGEKITNADQGAGGVQLADLQPLIDQWTTGAANEVRKYVKAG